MQAFCLHDATACCLVLAETLPTRNSQLDPAKWQAAGYNAADSARYCASHSAAMTHPNLHVQIRVPGAPNFVLLFSQLSNMAMAGNNTDDIAAMAQTQSLAIVNFMTRGNATNFRQTYWSSIVSDLAFLCLPYAAMLFYHVRHRQLHAISDHTLPTLATRLSCKVSQQCNVCCALSVLAEQGSASPTSSQRPTTPQFPRTRGSHCRQHQDKHHNHSLNSHPYGLHCCSCSYRLEVRTCTRRCARLLSALSPLRVACDACFLTCDPLTMCAGLCLLVMLMTRVPLELGRTPRYWSRTLKGKAGMVCTCRAPVSFLRHTHA